MFVVIYSASQTSRFQQKFTLTSVISIRYQFFLPNWHLHHHKVGLALTSNTLNKRCFHYGIPSSPLKFLLSKVFGEKMAFWRNFFDFFHFFHSFNWYSNIVREVLVNDRILTVLQIPQYLWKGHIFSPQILFSKIFFWCAPFGYLYFRYFVYVIASIAYIHPVYGVGFEPTVRHL